MLHQARRSRLGALSNTAIVAGGYLLSRVLGLLREIIIANQFGTGVEIGAYRAVFPIIDMIYIVLAGGALGSAFIPVFAGLLAEKKEQAAWRLASGILNIAFVSLVIGCMLIAVLADPIVALTVGSGFDADKRALTALLLRLMLLQPLLMGIGAISKATLESFDRFTLPALGANLYNIGIILGALLSPWLGAFGLVLGILLGALLFLLIQLPGLRAVGARYSLNAGLQTPGVGEVGRLIGPRLFGQAVWQINMIAIVSFASPLGLEAVAANGVAQQLMLLPHGLLALSVGTVIFPQLARAYALGDTVTVRDIALRAIRLVLFLALPASILLGTLSRPIVQLLFQRGNFDQTSTALTSQALSFYMLGLAAFAVSEIAVRSFYAMKDTRTPVVIALIAVITNIGLAWLFMARNAGLPGLASAFSIANTLEAALLLAIFGRRVGGLGRDFWLALGKMLLASVLSYVMISLFIGKMQDILPIFAQNQSYSWPADFPITFAWVVLAASFCALVYFAAALVLRMPEIRNLLERMPFRRMRDEA